MEEMPPFTEKESSILAVLKKKSGRMSAQEAQREAHKTKEASAAAQVLNSIEKSNGAQNKVEIFYFIHFRL